MFKEDAEKRKKMRLLIILAIMITFFAVFVSLIASYITRFEKELADESQSHLAEIASYVSFHMNNVVLDTQESLESVAAALVMMDSPETKMEYLKKMQEQYSFAYIGCAGVDGKLVATVSSESVDISGEDYYKKAIQGQASVSNLQRKIFNDRAASGILLTVPMGSGTSSGALVAMVEIAQLSKILGMENLGDDGYSYVFDKTGSIIMRSKSLDFSNLFLAWQSVEYEKGFDYDSFHDDVMNDREGIVQYTNLGVKKYAYYHPVEFNDWSVVNIVPEKSVTGRADDLKTELILLGITMVLTFLGLLYVALRSYSASQDSREATNAKSSFLANMSHEIRTPMNAIVGISEILLRDNLSLSQRNKVLNINSSGKGLLTVINDILDLSKIEAGKLSIIDESYELESMLYDLTVVTALKMGEKPVDFLIEMEPSLPRKFVGDMGRVKQVLLNIIGNAIKFTDEGSIHLIVNGVQQDGNWLLHMEIKDTGIGIKKEDLDKLFGSFSQVDIRRNRNIEGTGLGLTISQKLCEMMGGSIKVTSEYGKGSSFIVTIRQGVDGEEPHSNKLDKDLSLLLYEPSQILSEYEAACMDKLGIRYDICNELASFKQRAKTDSFTHILAGADALDGLDVKGDKITLFHLSEYSIIDSRTVNIYLPLFSQQLPYALNGISDVNYAPKNVGIDVGLIEPMPYVSVLIVDDNLVNIQVAKGLMEPYNMHIDEAMSGQQAIEAVQNKTYDLVLMDHMMPVMSGIEATKCIHALPGEKYKTLPIVALTANATSEARELFLNEGFDDFLAKPIETQKLNLVLRRILKGLNAQRASMNQHIASQTTKESVVIDKDVAVISTTNVDFEDGLQRMGSLPTYNMILGTYLRSSKISVAALADWLDRDKERFVIEIHGLKSASAVIGATKLSSLAAKMEQDGAAGNFEEMDDVLQEFLAQAVVVFTEIEAFLSQCEEPSTSDNLVKVGDNRKHIVVVDDNPVNLNLAQTVLSKDYRVTKLESGKALLRLLDSVSPDMILLDIQMPEMDGYETLATIKQHKEWEEIPVIFLTGQNDIQSEREGFRLGAKDFIKKPFDNIVMASRIQSQLELFEYQTELKQIITDKTREVQDLQHVITISWAEIIESRDGTTGSHVRNTTRYYKALLEFLLALPPYQERLADEDLSDLLRASALHDIGKIGISDGVLKKPGSLTPEEFDDMKCHAQIGADMVQKIIDNSRKDRFLIYAHEMALCHHERWDGTGYPNGLKGNEIPLYVQILTIADIFDALTAIRPYKRAFDFAEAIEIMQKDRGKFYAPLLFDVFIENKEIVKRLLESKED